MPRLPLIYCTLALLLFAFLSYSAVLTKSPTYDEPAHICSSYVALRYGDFSVEPDHPPLWKYLAALPLLTTHFNVDATYFHDIPLHVDSEFPWSVATLYETPENNTSFAVNSTRFMMLLCGIALGALIALFSFRLAGPLAACIAVTLFSLDPNFLAHASLVKNDVALALTYTALTYTLYLLCQRITPLRILSLLLCAAACITTKLTGLLAAPVIVILLFTRSLLPSPWPIKSSPFSSFILHPSSFRHRLLTAAALSLTCALFTYASIWAVYLFRFNPSPDPSVHYNTRQFLVLAAKADLRAQLHRDTATHAEFDAWIPPPSLRLALFALDHHLFPEPFLEGLIFANAASHARPSYFLGSVSTTGHLAYFPLAFLIKTPLTTLFTLLLSLLCALFASPFAPSCPSRSPPSSPSFSSFILHPSSFLFLPLLIFLLPALLTTVNIGIRHIFPIFPLLYIAASLPLARLYPRHPKLLRPTFAILLLSLTIETLSAYPNFIPFFNLSAGGSKGGFRLLGDSNLDWGQDLPLLAQWQRAHPTRTLYLAYFGTADPAYYNIHYHNLPHGYRFAPDPPPPSLPTTGVLAVSASTLQSIIFPTPPDPLYSPLLQRTPTQILGGSLYLYDLGGN